MVGVGRVVGLVITSVKEKKESDSVHIQKISTTIPRLTLGNGISFIANANEVEKTTRVNKSDSPFSHRL